MKHKYEVIVGNVGTMTYTALRLARQCYTTYVTLSQQSEGRASGEAVTLFKDGEIIAEFSPENTSID